MARPMQRTLNQIAIVSLVMLTTFGCTSMTGQTLGTNIDNKTMTAEVKTKLTADRLQNLGWVDVDTNTGVVYLGGTANTEAQKKRAGEIAAQVGDPPARHRGARRDRARQVLRRQRRSDARGRRPPAGPHWLSA
jgi:hypothetical protein